MYNYRSCTKVWVGQSWVEFGTRLGGVWGKVGLSLGQGWVEFEGEKCFEGI